MCVWALVLEVPLDDILGLKVLAIVLNRHQRPAAFGADPLPISEAHQAHPLPLRLVVGNRDSADLVSANPTLAGSSQPHACTPKGAWRWSQAAP